MKKLHGNTAHTGKFPKGRAEQHAKKVRKAELEELLKRAIETQEYEKAAGYRDAIRALEKEETAAETPEMPKASETPKTPETPKPDSPGDRAANA